MNYGSLLYNLENSFMAFTAVVLVTVNFTDFSFTVIRLINTVYVIPWFWWCVNPQRCNPDFHNGSIFTTSSHSLEKQCKVLRWGHSYFQKQGLNDEFSHSVTWSRIREIWGQMSEDSRLSFQSPPGCIITTSMLRLCSSVPLLLKTYDRLDWLIHGIGDL